MVKRQRNTARIRIRRYKLKNQSIIQSKQVNNVKDIAIDFLSFWLAFLDVIERTTLQILGNYGIDGEDIKKFFAYAKKLVKAGKVTNFLSILIDYQNALDWTIKRNPHYVDYAHILNEVELAVSKELGQYIRLWYGFYDLAFYDISIYLQ